VHEVEGSCCRLVACSFPRDAPHLAIAVTLLETTIGWRVVRRGDADAIRDSFVTRSIAGQDGAGKRRCRGQRAQREPAGAGTGIPARSPTAREARFRPQATDRRLQAKGAANGSFAPSLQPTVCSLQPVEALRTVPACRDGRGLPARCAQAGAGRGREPGARPALGADPGYGLRLNSRGTEERRRRA
jgi:hypothetical protein